MSAQPANRPSFVVKPGQWAVDGEAADGEQRTARPGLGAGTLGAGSLYG